MNEILSLSVGGLIVITYYFAHAGLWIINIFSINKLRLNELKKKSAGTNSLVAQLEKNFHRFCSAVAFFKATNVGIPPTHS
jgi:hypothetical protein